MITIGYVIVAGIVGAILILSLISCYSDDDYKTVNKTFSAFFY